MDFVTDHPWSLSRASVVWGSGLHPANAAGISGGRQTELQRHLQGPKGGGGGGGEERGPEVAGKVWGWGREVSSFRWDSAQCRGTSRGQILLGVGNMQAKVESAGRAPTRRARKNHRE